MRSWRDLAIASRTTTFLARAASVAARSNAVAAAVSSFFGFLLRPRASDDEAHAPSRMTRAPLLHPLVGGGDVGSFFTVVLGVDADPDERDADLDADPLDANPDEWDAICRGIHELPCQRDMEGTTGGGIPKTG
jgi:hypothetical protein